MLCIVLHRIFRHDFLFPRNTIVPGIENFPSASMFCYSGDMAQLLRPLKFVVQKYISPRINFCLYTTICMLLYIVQVALGSSFHDQFSFIL